MAEASFTRYQRRLRSGRCVCVRACARAVCFQLVDLEEERSACTDQPCEKDGFSQNKNGLSQRVGKRNIILIARVAGTFVTRMASTVQDFQSYNGYVQSPQSSIIEVPPQQQFPFPPKANTEILFRFKLICKNWD